MEGIELGECSICHLTGPLAAVQKHFLKEHAEEDTENDGNVSQPSLCPYEESEDLSLAINTETNVKEESRSKWPGTHTLLLIRLVEERYKTFETAINQKTVWTKIATELSKTTNQLYNADQTYNKFKGLKRTYKKIKDTNNSTGRNRITWEFYAAMDSFLGQKPEIIPPATCSSSSGLKINEETKSCVDTNTQPSPCNKKRKNVQEVERRHEEKIARMDKFLELYKLSVEHQIGKKIEDK